MKRFHAWLLAAALTLSAGAALAADSDRRQHRQGQRAGEDHPGMAGLNLSESQRAALREKHFASEHRAIEIRARLADARLRMHELISAPRLDAAAVRAQARRVAELQGELFQNRVDAHLDLLAVLDPAQRRKLIESGMGMGMHGGRGGMHGWRGPHGGGRMHGGWQHDDDGPGSNGPMGWADPDQ